MSTSSTSRDARSSYFISLLALLFASSTFACVSDLGGPTQEAAQDSQGSGGAQSGHTPNNPTPVPGDPDPTNPDPDPANPTNPREVLPDCVAILFDFGSKCAGAPCHDNGPYSGSGLDLASPDVLSRMIDKPATHKDVRDATTCPQGALLIDTANPTESWLLKKLDPNVTCGSPMPATAALSSEEMTCLNEWILSF